MNPISIRLRGEQPADYREVESLTREAFYNQFVPGCDEHYLAHVLRESLAFIPELDWVAEADGMLIGSILYSRARIALDAGGELPVLSFGPLSVLPAFQNQGVGRKLIEHTLTLAGSLLYNAVLIYGDPAYYSRRGFIPAETFGIGASDGLYRDALQAYELQPGALANAKGLFYEDPVYNVDSEASAAFDRLFPAKPLEADNARQRRFRETIAMCRPRI